MHLGTVLLRFRFAFRNARRCNLLQSKSPSGKCAKLHTVAASNNRDHPTRSLYYFLFAPHIYLGFVLRAHSLWGESHIQRYANREIATKSIKIATTCHILNQQTTKNLSLNVYFYPLDVFLP